MHRIQLPDSRSTIRSNAVAGSPLRAEPVFRRFYKQRAAKRSNPRHRTRRSRFLQADVGLSEQATRAIGGNWPIRFWLGPDCFGKMLERVASLASPTDSGRMGVTPATKILLAMRSGGICAMPGCGRHLTYDATAGTDTYIAEAAHIRGEKSIAARYDASMTEAERNAIDNLIYFCADDHTIIDKVEADWPVAKLQKIKLDHERKVRETMIETFADVAFPELASAVSWVATQAPTSLPSSFEITSPDEKIRKNDLSSSARLVIASGLVSQATVASYVEAEAQLDSDFPDKLRSGFLSEYHALRHKGHKGEELFELMCAFAVRGLKKQIDRTAGLAVLVYLFEICDVFER